MAADAIILAVAGMHVFEALTLVGTTHADGAIELSSILAVFGSRWVAVLVMLGAAAMAVVGRWAPGFDRRLQWLALLPQFSLLCITALGAVVAIYYAGPAWIASLCEQIPRMASPAIYLIVVSERARYG